MRRIIWRTATFNELFGHLSVLLGPFAARRQVALNPLLVLVSLSAPLLARVLRHGIKSAHRLAHASEEVCVGALVWELECEALIHHLIVAAHLCLGKEGVRVEHAKVGVAGIQVAVAALGAELPGDGLGEVDPHYVSLETQLVVLLSF